MFEFFVPFVYVFSFCVGGLFLFDYLFSTESSRSGKFVRLCKWDDGFPNTKTYSVILKERNEYVNVAITKDKYKKMKDAHEETYVYTYSEGPLIGKVLGWKYRLLLK